jgi:hypothetical protein
MLDPYDHRTASVDFTQALSETNGLRPNLPVQAAKLQLIVM